MIVISILIMISAFSIAVYIHTTHEQKLEYEVSRYKDILNYARQNALLNNTEGFNCPDYFGHKIRMNTNKDGYALQICCYEACNCDPVGDTGCMIRHVKDYELQDDIVFKEKKDVRFRENAGGTGSSSNTLITLKSTSLNKCIDVIITKTGLIKENNIHSCSD